MIETDICSFLKAIDYDHVPILPRVLEIGDKTAVRRTDYGLLYRRNYERAILLVALASHYRSCRFLEFGTGRGFVVGCIRNLTNTMDYITTIDKENPGNAQRLLRFVGASVDKIDWIMRDSMELGKIFNEEDWIPNLRINYDLVFIDGLHSKQGVENDLMLAEEVTAKQCVVVVSDYNDRFPGVKESVDESIWLQKKWLVSTNGWIVENSASSSSSLSGITTDKEVGSGMVVGFVGFEAPNLEGKKN